MDGRRMFLRTRELGIRNLTILAAVGYRSKIVRVGIEDQQTITARKPDGIDDTASRPESASVLGMPAQCLQNL